MRCTNILISSVIFGVFVNPANADDDKIKLLKDLSPIVMKEHTLDEIYQEHESAKTKKVTKNTDGTEELIWGNNEVNHHVMLKNGKVSRI